VGFGSAWGAAGDFYEVIRAGTTPTRVVLGPTPTWVAAPHVREEALQRKEPDPRRFAREYACEFQATDLHCFTPELVDPCFGIPQMENVHRPFGLIDTAMGRGDTCAWGCGQPRRPFADDVPEHLWLSLTRNRGLVREDLLEDGDEVLHAQATPARDARGELIPNPMAGHRPPVRLALWGLGSLEGKFAQAKSFADMIAMAAKTFRRNGVHDVFGDSFMAFSVAPELQKHGLRYRELVWTNESKSRGVLRARQLCREQGIAIEESDEGRKLRGELFAFREKILPSGVVTYGARSGAHDDRVALLINLAIADTDQLIYGSPIGIRGGRHEL
jgi:hypothetical protein